MALWKLLLLAVEGFLQQICKIQVLLESMRLWTQEAFLGEPKVLEQGKTCGLLISNVSTASEDRKTVSWFWTPLCFKFSDVMMRTVELLIVGNNSGLIPLGFQLLATWELQNNHSCHPLQSVQCCGVISTSLSSKLKVPILLPCSVERWKVIH